MSEWRLEFRPLDPLFGQRAPGEGYLILTDGERECRPCRYFRENYPDDLAEGERENFQRMSDDLNAGRWTWDKTYANRVIYAPDGRDVPLDEIAERLTLSTKPFEFGV